MLKRIHIKGYKSLTDVEVHLEPLSILLGPNASGKSNFLDALQLLSKLVVVGKTLKDAFEPPYRGKLLESFSLPAGGLKQLIKQKRLSFSIEADMALSDTLVENVNHKILEMRRSGNGTRDDGTRNRPAQVRERHLRYRIELEMLPRSGVLRVADEYLAPLTKLGEPKKRKPFLERQGEKIHLRMEGQAHPTYYERYLDRSILSMPHYPPHYPHLEAARQELESCLFFYFEPRERMRAENPVKEVNHIGLMGEELAAFLNTLKALHPAQFEAIEKAMCTLIPSIQGIVVRVNDLGEVELQINENGIAVPARVLSEGTLRMLGLLALTGVKNTPALVGLEEPENGVHPRRIALIAELLKTQARLKQSQYLVTTHSPTLIDQLPYDSLYTVNRIKGSSCIAKLSDYASLGPINRKKDTTQALETTDDPIRLTVSDLIMRGDLDA